MDNWKCEEKLSSFELVPGDFHDICIGNVYQIYAYQNNGLTTSKNRLMCSNVGCTQLPRKK